MDFIYLYYLESKRGVEDMKSIVSIFLCMIVINCHIFSISAEELNLNAKAAAFKAL